MPTMTLRIEDEVRTEIEVFARGRGETASDVVRAAIDNFLGREDERPRSSGQPQSLTLVERRILASQHQILGAISQDEYDCDHHRKVVEILERGFTGEYDSVFAGFDAEMPRRECEFVRRLLDMFHFLQLSFERLDDDAKAGIGEHADWALSFRGFDFNDSSEARLARYARFLVDGGSWEELNPVFERDGGNSHSPMLGSYRRMLNAFEPIWERKVSDYSGTADRFFLNVDELKAVYAAWPHTHR